VTIDALLDRLDGVRRRGDTATARCPGHDDRQASLSITQPSVGALLIHCHTGCPPEQVLASIGLSLGDLSVADDRVQAWAPRRDGELHLVSGGPGSSVGREPEPLPTEDELAGWVGQLDQIGPWLIQARCWETPTLARLGVGYDGRRLVVPYRDAQGVLIGAVRYRPGAVPKAIAAGGHGRHLFPAPESLEGHGHVLLVEGEPDAITGHQLGLPAVSVPGVSAWRDEWTERLCDRRVTVALDADEAGRRAAMRVGQKLSSAGIAVAICDLAPDRDDGMDLTDLHVAAVRQGRVDALREHVHARAVEAWERWAA